MDKKVQEVIDYTRRKLGLVNYTIKRHEIFRESKSPDKTSYLLSMEWFPNGVKQIDEAFNPSGSVSVDIDIHTLAIQSIVFVQGISYAEEAPYPALEKEAVIQWVENMTELKYEHQFKLVDYEDDYFRFQATIESIPLSPPGFINVEFNLDEQLSSFYIEGNFPINRSIVPEQFTLTLDSVADIAKNQCKLMNFPDDIDKKWLPTYGLEEVYVTNNDNDVLPFEYIERFPKPIRIDQVLEWDKVIKEEYTYEDIDLSSEVSIEQALNLEADPNTFPITESEQNKCRAETKQLLQREYGSESGKWTLTSVYREHGYFIAEVKPTLPKNNVIERKLKIIIDSINLHVINFVDNKAFVNMFAHFQEADPVIISQEDAFKKLYEYIEITPVYVFDSECEKYILSGKIDCNYGMNGANGEVVLLEDI